MSKCLVCFKATGGGDYHPACCRKVFESSTPVQVAFSCDQLPSEGLRLLAGRGQVPGVQAKLSVDRDIQNPSRLTIRSFKGRYILKPPSLEYPELPENEALCMRLAAICGLEVAAGALVRMADGVLAYISRRFDRPSDGRRLHQEDFCQVSERPAADKYKGSLEAASKVLGFSRQAGLDAVRFLELNLFCWFSGNADMHLKNFSLLQTETNLWQLSPAYDLVSTALILPSDREETALTVNGKKAQLGANDWLALARHLKIPEKVFEKLWQRMRRLNSALEETLAVSFLSDHAKDEFLRRWAARISAL